MSEIVLYDVNNPSKSILSSNNASILLLILGALLILLSFVIFRANISTDETEKQKLGAWIWLSTILGIFTLQFVNYNFSFSNFIYETGYSQIIFLILFGAIGIYFLVITYNPNSKINVNNHLSSIEKFKDDNMETIENIQNTVNKLAAIIEIVFGFIWTITVLIIIIIPRLLPETNFSYTLNNVVVSKKDFFTDPIINIITIVFPIIGIIIIINGFLKIRTQKL